MKMNAHLHAILLFAGFDPAVFMTEMQWLFPDMSLGFNAADVINSARPGAGFQYVNVWLCNGRIELSSLGGRDEGGKIEIMMIGDSHFVSFTPRDDAEGAFALMRNGARELRETRMLGDLRKPVADKPEWLAEIGGQVSVWHHSLSIHSKAAYVDVDVTLRDPFEDGRLAA